MSNERMTDAALAICSNGIPDAERMLKELRELCDRSINAGGERYILPNTDRYLLIWAMDAITTADAALRARPQAVGELYCVGRANYPSRGGNVGLQWHVIGVADVPYRTCVPKNGELLFVLAASQSATGGA